MNNILENLRKLQALDLEILKLTGGSGEPTELKEIRERLALIDSQVREKLRQVDRLGPDRNQTKAGLDLCRQRIVRTETAMKGIKNADSFQVATKELAQLKSLEQSLELKEAGFEKEARFLNLQLTELQDERDAVGKMLETQSKLTLAKDQKVSSGIQEIEERKVHFQDQMPARYLSLYRKIAISRGGIGAVEVKGSSCGACHMILPAQFINELRRSKSIEQCPNCKRILLIEAGEKVQG